jgi:SET domain-containing protein
MPFLDIIIDNDDAPNTKVKASFTEGYGLFAAKDFEAGEIIVNYNLFPDSWYHLKYSELCEEKKRKNLYVMVDSENCITSDNWSKFSYINHSRNPNCLWKPEERLVVAQKNITVGDELFIDYRLEPKPKGMTYASWV